MTTQLLLVEDDEAHAELVARAYESDDRVDLTCVARLAAARDLLASPQGQFDLVLTDLRLPDGRGTELIDLDPKMVSPPVIVMTSQGDEKAAVEAIKAGALDYLVKSETTFTDMPRISERALREWRLLREQRRLRRALDQHEQLAAVGTAAAMLAHEIGNPLNSMALHAELLQRRLRKLEVDDPQVDKQIANWIFEIRRLAALLQDFRTLSRKQVVDPTPVRIDQFLAELVDRYRPAIGDRAIEVDVELAGDLGEVELDADKMTQVLLNLLMNASEAMSEGGAITIAASRDRELFRLVVADNGPGIPDGVDVFAPFQSSKPDGSGLGLPIVHRIVAAHGGTITYTPNTPRGARFEIVLPIQIRVPDPLA